MITVTGETIDEICHKLDKKFTFLKDVKEVSNGYIVTLPEDARNKKIIIKFGDEKTIALEYSNDR